jgi:hypothetical protein
VPNRNVTLGTTDSSQHNAAWTPDPEKFYTSRQAAEVVGASVRTVSRLCAEHVVNAPTYKGVRRYFYPRDVIDALARERSARSCAICDQPTPNPRMRTCGHPVCVKRHRLNRVKKPTPKAVKPAPTGVLKKADERADIIRQFRARSYVHGPARYFETASACGVTIATVIGVINHATRRN